MIRVLRAYYTMLTQVGSGIRIGREIDQLFRYYVLETLNEDGLFECLNEQRTYGQILSEMAYTDNKYTRFLFEVLSGGKQPVLIKSNNSYHRNPAVPLPQLDEVAKGTSRRVHNFGLMAKGMTRYILPRLRNEPVELSSTFEIDGRQLLSKFDKTLGARMYTGARDAVFALLPREEHKWLRGKKLLEVGCGSGRETAEIWLRYGGDIYITAIDPIVSMLELARRHFADYLDEMEPAHSPLTKSNQPVFDLVGATSLPYADNTFDAVFCSFVLHWTPNPQKAISEMVRVVKPGGILFGVQPTKPAANPYFDLVVRVSENAHGFFWTEEFRRWFAEQGVEIETHTPVTMYRGRKRVRV